MCCQCTFCAYRVLPACRTKFFLPMTLTNTYRSWTKDAESSDSKMTTRPEASDRNLLKVQLALIRPTCQLFIPPSQLPVSLAVGNILLSLRTMSPQATVVKRDNRVVLNYLWQQPGPDPKGKVAMCRVALRSINTVSLIYPRNHNRRLVSRGIRPIRSARSSQERPRPDLR